MLTDFVRAFMPADSEFPSNRTTAAILELMQNADAAIRPFKIQYCSVFTLQREGAEAIGVRSCAEPTVYYGACADRPNCAGCTNLKSEARLNSSLLILRVADWIQVQPLCTAQIILGAPMHSSWTVLVLLWCQLLFTRADTRDAMREGFTTWTPPNLDTVVSDVMHSRRFTNKCGPFISPAYARRVGSPHASKASARNVVLMLYADGVNATEHSDYSMFVLTCAVVNLPREQRRLRPNILPLLVIPGPRPPKDMTAFLQPLIDELSRLWKDGTSVRTLDSTAAEQRQCIRAMVFTIIADSRAHPKLSMMMQSPAKFPCHLCEVQVSAQSHHAQTMIAPQN